MIRFISSSNVLPSCIDSDRDNRLELTPCDLLHLVFVPIQNCLIFKKPDSPSIDSLVDHLKATLSIVLDIFYPLAGRLSVSDDTTYSIDCRPFGAQFIHAAADGVTAADLLAPGEVPKEQISCFFPMNGVLNYKGVSEPLFAAQVTEIADGIVLALSASHVAIDATSFWHFLNAWSHIARGGAASSSSVCPLPVFDRRGLFGGVFELPIPIPFPYNKLPSLARPKKQGPAAVSRIIGLSKETIAELKAKANRGGGDNDVISSLQAIMAHLWVSVTRSRGLDPAEEVSYMFVVGLRPRLPLPEGYFGNAVKTVVARSTAGEILCGEEGFMEAARRINDVISAQTPGTVKGYLTEWVEKPTLAGSGARALPPNMLLMGGSPRFDVFGNDFGWGPPVAMRQGGGGVDGLVWPMPPAAGDGSIEFELMLSQQTMLALLQDPDFAGRVSVK